LDGGVITPPSNGMALSATIAAGTSGAVASGAAASGAAASGAQSPRHCRYSTPSSSRDGGVE